MLNDMKYDINGFFKIITDKKDIWCQFIQNTEIEIKEKDKKLTMNIKLYLDFPEANKLLIKYKDPKDSFQKEVLDDFYSKIKGKSFDDKILTYQNYKNEQTGYSASGAGLNLKIINGNIDTKSLNVIKAIDGELKCDELLKIYKRFKVGDLYPLFFLKEDLGLKNDSIDTSSSLRECKIKSNFYQALYKLKKNNKYDSLSEDLKAILDYCSSKKEFDKIFKGPLEKYNKKYKSDVYVFDCSWLNELYLYLTDKKRYCIEVLKFNKYTVDKLFEFNGYNNRITLYSSLSIWEYNYSDGINVEALYKDLLDYAKGKFIGLYAQYMKGFDNFISDLKSAGNLSEEQLKEKIEEYFGKNLANPINIVEQLGITSYQNIDELIKIIETIYGKVIEDYFIFKYKNIYLNIDVFLKKIYKYLIDKVIEVEKGKINSYDFDKTLEFNDSYNKRFIEYFDKIVDKYINDYKDINKYSKTFKDNESNETKLKLLLLPDYYEKDSIMGKKASYIDIFSPELKKKLEQFFTTYFNTFMSSQKTTIKGLDNVSKYDINDKDTLISKFVDFLKTKCKVTTSGIFRNITISGIDFDKAIDEINQFKQNRQKEITEEMLRKITDENTKKLIENINKKIEDIKKSLTVDIENIKTKEQYNQFKYKNSKEINDYITAELGKIENYSENYDKYIVKGEDSEMIISNIDNNKTICCDTIVSALNLKSNKVFIVKLNYNIKEQNKFKNDIINLCNEFINKNKTYDSRKTYSELYKYIVDSLSCVDNIFKGDKSIKDSNDVINEDELSLTLVIKKVHLKDEFKEKPIVPHYDNFNNNEEEDVNKENEQQEEVKKTESETEKTKTIKATGCSNGQKSENNSTGKCSVKNKE